MFEEKLADKIGREATNKENGTNITYEDVRKINRKRIIKVDLPIIIFTLIGAWFFFGNHYVTLGAAMLGVSLGMFIKTVWDGRNDHPPE